jgi:hypothetical protein
MTELYSISMADKIACVEREIKLRMKVFGRLVSTGAIREEKAEREIAIMQAIMQDYLQKASDEQRALRPGREAGREANSARGAASA